MFLAPAVTEGGQEALCSLRFPDSSVSYKYPALEIQGLCCKALVSPNANSVELATVYLVLKNGLWAEFYFTYPIYLKITLNARSPNWCLNSGPRRSLAFLGSMLLAWTQKLKWRYKVEIQQQRS